ncbi:MAG TPA: hypothetical protein VFR41_11365 [Acidimicrobiia bacterium]|nr:hypothetical protein [Acidimicrobiia bacterium]
MRRRVAFISAVALLGTVSISTPGTALGLCRGNEIKPRVHDAVVKRDQTLDALVAALQHRNDPFQLNADQITALQQARSSLDALDAHITNTCYPTLVAFRTDVEKILTDYRVYWLRVPQTHVVGAADHLGTASAKLQAAAAKLAALVNGNATAQTDLAAMNASLATADAKVGTAPHASASITAVVGLAPAADMSADDAALKAAYADLVAARTALVHAREQGLKVVADLK